MCKMNLKKLGEFDYWDRFASNTCSVIDIYWAVP